MEMQTPQMTENIRYVLKRLQMTTLEPDDEVNSLFSQLVIMAQDSIEPDEATILEAQRLASEGEGKLERHWAQRIIENPTELSSFPYFNNYAELAAHEYEALKAHDKIGPAQQWAFIGSGPLPLSVIMLERLHGSATFTYIDSSAEANQLGEATAVALNGSHPGRRFITADATDVSYQKYDVVIMAALVGQTQTDKHDILDHIATSCKPDAMIAARSVPAGGRTLLYPRLTSTPLALRTITETIPPEGVINSLVLMRKR